MNPIDFLFKLLANFLEFTPDEMENVRQEALKSWENSTGKIKEFLSHPYILIMLPILLPFAVKGTNRLIARLGIDDEDKDGEVDLADLALKLAQGLEKLKQK